MKSRHILSAVITLGLLVSFITPAAAQPICSGALRLRVNDSGLKFITEQVKPLVPKSVSIPAIKKSVIDWPLVKDDAIVETALQAASIKLKDLKISISGDALQVRGKVDVGTSGPVTVHNAYLGVGTANCQADVQVKDLELVIGLHFATNGGKITTQVTEALFTLDNDNTVLSLKGCALGNILTTVVNFLRKHFMSTIQSVVGKMAKSKIPALVAARLDETIAISKEFKGFKVTGTLDALATDSLGVEVGLGAGIGLVANNAATCLGNLSAPAPVSCASTQPRLSPAVDAMFGVGVSEQIINQGLTAAWRSGLLCVDSDRLTSPLLTENMSKLAPILGQPAGTKLLFNLRLLSAPEVSMTTAGGLTLSINKLLLRLVMTPPGGPRNEVMINTGISAAVIPWINPGDNSVSLEVKSLSMSGLEIPSTTSEPGAGLSLDPARLNRFIAEVAMPLLKQKLSEGPISPSVVAVSSFLVEMRRFEVGNGYLAAYINGHIPVLGNDNTAPDTKIKGDMPMLVGPGVLRITAGGQDDKTPSALMRYQARIDRGAWSKPAYGGRLQLAVSGGAHTVEVAAVDQNGNVDSTPATYTIMVDDVVPKLSFWGAPDPVVADDQVTVHFDGSDDRTAADKLIFVAQLFRNNPADGTTDLVQHQTLSPGVREATFPLMQEGVFRIRVTVKDGAGNVTSQDMGFVVDHRGCSMLGGTDTLPPLSLAALLLLLIRRRQRR